MTEHPNDTKYSMVNVFLKKSHMVYKTPINAIANLTNKYLYMVEASGLSIKNDQVIYAQSVTLIKKVNINQHKLFLSQLIKHSIKEQYMSELEFDIYADIEHAVDDLVYSGKKITRIFDKNHVINTPKVMRHYDLLIAVEDMLDGLLITLVDLHQLVDFDEHILASMDIETRYQLGLR